jgi:glycosyltransferase involved in cell wall biosynthesis
MLSDSLEHLDILCFSSTDWHGKWGSRQQVMTRMAQLGHRVLFVERQAGFEHIIRYPDMLSRKIKRWREGILKIAERLWIVSLPPLVPGRYYSEVIAHWNQGLVKMITSGYASRLGIKMPILWLFRPEHGGLIGGFNEQLRVYHCIDEFTAGTRGRKREIIIRLELETLRKADVVLANSLLTYENKRIINPNTYRIPSGVDLQRFSRVMSPDLLPHPSMTEIPQPIAGYVGNINKKLDIPMLSAVADRLPNWNFVFVGQVDPSTPDLPSLKNRRNVHFLGRFPFDEVPSFLKKMDVCLLPYEDIEFTRYRSPLKLYEYLAAGKPIVSTDHPEVREFSDYVEVASTAEDFSTAIQCVHRDESSERKQKRVEVSKLHSWDSRVDEIEQIISSALKQK